MRELLDFFKFLINEIARDTLMREENGRMKWSRTSLTMLVSFATVIFIALADFYKHGYNSEVFIILATMAAGVKITDAFSKKLNK